MVDGTENYTEWENDIWKTQSNFIRENNHYYQILESILGFQFSILKQMNSGIRRNNPNLPSNYRDWPNQHKAEPINLSLCIHNNEHLYSAFRTLEKGFNAVCENIIRIIYESIPKIVYQKVHPEDISIILAKEAHVMWLMENPTNSEGKKTPFSFDMTKEKFLESDHAKNNFNAMEITHIQKSEKLDEKYTPKWFRNQIYGGKRLETQHNIHSLLSLSSHPNTHRARLQDILNSGNDPKLMRVLTELSFFSLLLTVNLQKQTLSKIGKWEECTKILTQKSKELGKQLSTVDLYPNHAEYKNVLEFIPPEN